MTRLESGRGKAASVSENILGESGLNRGKSAMPRRPAQPPKSDRSIRCPECGSQRVWKDGLRRTQFGKVQRYICRDCTYRFTESSQRQVKVHVPSEVWEPPHLGEDICGLGAAVADFSGEKKLYIHSLGSREDATSHNSSLITESPKSLNTFPYHNLERRVCDSDGESKNLAVSGPRQLKKAGAGAVTEPINAEIRGKIVDFSWWLKKKGYREATILTNSRQLEVLAKRGANILDPESVKETIAKQPWAESRKAVVVAIYTLFLKMLGRKWDPPIYKPIRKIPFIPTEKEIDDLIAGCGLKLSAYLQLLKETGMRSGEADHLKWTDIDFERRVVRVTPEKGSNPRVLPLTAKCIAMIKALPKKSRRVFGNLSLNTMRSSLSQSRAKLARKLNNPRLLQIHFHTLRHWKATMLYHQTKDILYVKEFMGHRSIQNTLLYVQIENALFQGGADSFTCRVARTEEEIKELIEAGFEYVTQKDDLVYFRKRK